MSILTNKQLVSLFYKKAKEIKPDIVFHAAAYKHVSFMEDNIYEATRINILGTKIIADLSFDYDIKKFLFVSTDKAVNPTSVMGASKRISELYLHYLNDKMKTEYVITRFGNVFGSSGSVIPTFIDRLNKNRNLCVTHKKVIRYFMSIPESAKLVIKAVTIGVGGEILLFDMGKPVKIIDLAQNLLKMFPRKNVSIEIIGLQPGEKLYEELLAKEENTLATHHPQILKAKIREENDSRINDISTIFEDLTKKEILKVAENYGSAFMKNPTSIDSEKNYLMIHTGNIYLIDSSGQVRAIHFQDTEVKQIVNDIKVILDST